MYNEDFFAEPGVPSQADIEAEKEKERLGAEQIAREAAAAAEQTATVEEQSSPVATPPIQAEVEDPEETNQQPQQQESDDGMNNPISQFLEGAAVEVRDWIDDKLQGDQQTKEEIRTGRDAARADSQKSSKEYIEATRGSVLQEGVRAVASGAEKQVKDIQEFGSLVGDTFKTLVGDVEKGDIYNDINADGYTALERDMVIAEPTTAVGLFARDMISFMGISNRVKALTGASKVNQAIGGINSKAGRWAARAGSEMIYGAIADLIVDPGDANASNLIIEKIPGAERFIGMFAIDEDDSAWEKRFKGMGDGAIMGLGVEGVGVLLRGSKIGARHLAKWAKGRKGVKPSDAPAEVQAEAARLAEDAINKEMDEFDLYHGTYTKNAEKIQASGFKPSKGETDTLGRGVYFTRDRGLAKAYGDQQLGANSSDINIKELTYDEVQEVMGKYGGLNKQGGPVDVDSLAKEFGDEYDAVSVKGLYDNDANIDEVLVFDPKKADELIAPKSSINQPPGARPGFDASVKENNFNGSTPDRPSSYEPYERAGARSSYPIQDVMADQAALRGRVRFSGESPNPALTDVTARQLSSAVDDEATYEFIENAYKSVDVDKLRKDLITKDAAVRGEALKTLKQFAEDNVDKVDMEALLRTIKTTGDVKESVIRSIIGQKVVKTLIVDTATQLRDLGTNFTEIKAAGQDGFRQAEMMFDRMKALVILQVEDASTSGLKLQSLQNPVRKFLSPTAEKKVKDIWDKMDDLKARVQEGDPVAAKELETLADSFILADGDGQMADSFIEKFFKMSRQNFETTMYNSYLSGLNTQQRNILGNATQIIMRPAEMALGSIGNTSDRQAALSMYGSLFQSMKEGLQVAKASWADFKPDGLEKATADGTMYKQLENLRASAKTPAENAAALFASAQYQLMASPWLQTPMKALNAADHGFRAVSARQMAHFDFMKMAMEDGIKFDPKKFETYYSTKFKDGQIVDERLLKIAKEDTFQEDLGVTMTMVSDVFDRVPMMKYVVPFIKTPTNIIKRTAHYIPMAGYISRKTRLADVFFKEYSQVMKGSDETAKAIYKGREAVGYMTAVTFGTLGFNGLSTGAGPRDYKEKKRWEMEGIKPHSINIGGVWVSNRFLGPIGILMSAYSDLGMIAERRGSYESFNDLRNQLMYTTAGSLLDQSWLKGLVGSLEYLSDAAMGQRELNVEDTVASLSRALIPYQAALRSWSNTLVPGMREYNNEFEKVLAESIPGLKALLGAERVSLKDGKPLTNAGYSALNQVTPFNLSEVRTDPVIGQLNDLGVGFPTEYMDTVEGVKLTATQKQAIHKGIAASGWYEKVKNYLEGEDFKEVYGRWESTTTPTSRDNSAWMNRINGILVDAKKEGYQNYIDSGTPEAVKLREMVEAAQQSKTYSKIGNFQAAADADALKETINLAQPN